MPFLYKLYGINRKCKKILQVSRALYSQQLIDLQAINYFLKPITSDYQNHLNHIVAKNLFFLIFILPLTPST